MALSVSSAPAAEISLSEKPGCLFEMTGEIGPGDVDRFAQMANAHWTRSPYEQSDNADAALCLDSRGGSFQAGHRISLLVHELSMATRVGPGAECLSACALMFMAGRNSGTEVDRPRRILDVSGRLGFHAPFTQLDDTLALTGKDVNAFVPEFTDMIAAFIRHASFRAFTQHRPSISLGLLVEMLDTPSDAMFEIDTVERAARWGVDLDGVRDGPRFTLGDYVQLCDNQFAWIYDGESMRVQDDLSYLRYETLSKPMQTGPEDFIVFDRGGMAPMVCEIELFDPGTAGTGLCLSDGFTGLGLGDCDDPAMPFSVWVPWWHAMPPDMPLQALG